jgi:hypothetical protein
MTGVLPSAAMTGFPAASVFGTWIVYGSYVFATVYGLKFWIMPWEARRRAKTRQIGTSR